MEILNKIEEIGKKIINEISKHPFKSLVVAILIVYAVKWIKSLLKE